jgi:hypothetical protein
LIFLDTIPSKFLCLSLEFLQHILLDRIVAGFVLLDDSFADPDPLEAKGIVFLEIVCILNIEFSTFAEHVLILNASEGHLLLQEIAVLLVLYLLVLLQGAIVELLQTALLLVGESYLQWGIEGVLVALDGLDVELELSISKAFIVLLSGLHNQLQIVILL